MFLVFFEYKITIDTAQYSSLQFRANTRLLWQLICDGWCVSYIFKTIWQDIINGYK